ncbi:hypothetical protein BH23ACT6_BH23ACT6_27390 [soil metagenome]
MRYAGPRLAVGLVGAVLGLWGAWLIFGSADVADLVNIAIWLGGGVIAHDLLIAAITFGVAAVATRLLPQVARAPATVGFVVLGTITVVAIPFLGRFGARANNPTLLDRNYVGGYLTIVAIVVLCVVAASIIRSRHLNSASSSARSESRAATSDGARQ